MNPVSLFFFVCVRKINSIMSLLVYFDFAYILVAILGHSLSRLGSIVTLSTMSFWSFNDEICVVVKWCILSNNGFNNIVQT